MMAKALYHTPFCVFENIPITCSRKLHNPGAFVLQVPWKQSSFNLSLTPLKLHLLFFTFLETSEEKSLAL